MKDNYRKLGELVDLIDERNSDEKVKTLIGVSIDKCFIKSVANTIGTDLSKYQIIRKNDFACSLMQVSRDGKIPIACLKDYDEAIMSPAYYIFRIKDTNKILPDYLTMWFMRTEFDREASYIAIGGVRGSMPWEDFCKMELPVPDLIEQQRIVNAYNTVDRRIRLLQQINEKLETTAQTIYRKMFVDSDEQKRWKDGVIGDVLQLQRGHDLPRSEMKTGNYPVEGSNETIGFHNEYTTKNPVIVMGRSGNIGNPRICFYDCWVHNTALYVKQFYNSEPIWCFYLLKNLNYGNFTGGSAVPTLDRKVVHSQKIKIPSKENQTNFSNKVKLLLHQKDENQKELEKLQNLKQLIISRISGM